MSPVQQPGIGVPTRAVGTPRVHLRATDSTNLRARTLANAGAPDGTLVTAAAQSAGRGRQGRVWTAPAGTSLLMSVIVREPGPLLSLAAGVAVAETAQHFRDGARVGIKWPNDVWLDGAKVAGILVEGRPQEGWAVLGIGFNVAIAEADFPPELRGRATGLGLASQDVEDVLARLLEALRTWIPAPGAAILDGVRNRDALKGRTVSWAGGRGIAAGIAPGGELMVDTPAGAVRLDAGEVHLSLG